MGVSVGLWGVLKTYSNQKTPIQANLCSVCGASGADGKNVLRNGHATLLSLFLRLITRLVSSAPAWLSALLNPAIGGNTFELKAGFPTPPYRSNIFPISSFARTFLDVFVARFVFTAWRQCARKFSSCSMLMKQSSSFQFLRWRR